MLGIVSANADRAGRAVLDDELSRFVDGTAANGLTTNDAEG